MSKTSTAEKIRQAMRKHPNAKPAVIAKELNVSASFVYAVRAAMRKKAKLLAEQRVPNVNPTITIAPTSTGQIEMFEPASDPVNHPSHYKVGGIETIDFIEAKKLNYNLGNVVKYVTRADHKGNRKQDLEKAMWYLQREIGNL